jgi:hypothetical protein
MVIELMIAYFPVAIAVAFIDIIAKTQAKYLSRRLGNGLGFLLAWFVTSAICFTLGMGAFRGLAWLMEAKDFGPFEALGRSLTTFVSIVAPPVWLNFQRDVAFVRRGSWRLPAPVLQIMGIASAAAIVALTLNLALGSTAFDDIDWLTQVPMYFSAILIGAYVLGHYLGLVPDATPAPKKQEVNP